MANNPIGTLIQPTGVNGGYDNKDYERASYVDMSGGTIGVRVANSVGGDIVNGFVQINPNNVTFLQVVAVANGTGTLGTAQGEPSYEFLVTGIGTATVNFGYSPDGTTFYGLAVKQVGGTTVGTSTTTNGEFIADITGLTQSEQIYARISNWSAGTINVIGAGVLYPTNLAAGGGGGGAGGGGTQYAELGTVGTATGNAIVFRSTAGTLRAVGTDYPIPNQEMFAPAYEDNTNNVAGIAMKPVAASAYSPSGTFFPYGSAAVGTVLKTTAGMLIGFSASNETGTACYFQIHNGSVRPATGATPIFSFVIPPGSPGTPGIRSMSPIDLGGAGVFLSTGVSYGISTVAGTFAASGTASHVVNAMFF